MSSQSSDCPEFARPEENAGAGAGLESLPPELIRHILSLLPDVSSLLSALLTGPKVYEVFIPVEKSITSQVVKNLIPNQVLPEATLAWKSSRLAPQTKDILQDFLNNQFQPAQILSSWTLKEALCLDELHRHVDFFSLDFASKVWTKLSESANFSGATLSGFPTSTELCRIQRAFYRFEIYCNLFRSREGGPEAEDEEEEDFFLKFSLWENEQLGCIHDYLFYKTAPAFNEITDHDVAWGAAGILHAFDLDDAYMQQILSRGLRRLHAIAVARDYDERHRLIYGWFPRSNTEFLYEGLRAANEWFNDRLRFSGSEDKIMEYVKLLCTPFMQESDTGPAEAWSWAHQDGWSSDLIYDADSGSWLREQGYVFWDRARLEAWHVFQSPWEAPDMTAAEAEMESHRTAALLDWENYPRRAQIFRLGGRGWWSRNDESRVVYHG